MNNNQENLHGMSRFSIFGHDTIEKCQWDYVNGNDLNQTLSGIDEKIIRQIISETYNADQLVKARNPEVLFSARLSGLDDWSLSVLGEIMFQYQAQFQADPSKASVANLCDEQGWQAWKQILKSPQISPCISYDLLFMEVANKLRFEQDKRSIEIMKDGLAYAVMQGETLNAFNMIRDLGDMYISFSEIEPGLEIYAELLLASPNDIWNYNAIALSLDTSATASIGLQAVRRGLELLKTTGDEMGLAAQFGDMAKELEKKADRQAITLKEINPTVLQKMETALTIGFDDGYDIDLSELCRKVVPDLDSRSVKQYPKKIDLPSKEQVRWNLADTLSSPLEKKQTRSTTQPQKVNVQQSVGKIGRNDPCPCGSGKKYKKCCLK